MDIGQITNRYKHLSSKADYLQLDICGLDSYSALEKLVMYKEKNPHLSKVILHGDWTKKGFSENNIKNRYNEYIEIINSLKKHIEVLGITIHPPYRSKYTLEEFLVYCDAVSRYTNVFIENRSISKVLLSNPVEIVDASQKVNMTIDIPQLYISCNYDSDCFMNILKEINHENVLEYHLGNIKRTSKNTFVARKLDDPEGILKYHDIITYLNNKSFFTLEILGGSNTFESQLKYLNSFISK